MSAWIDMTVKPEVLCCEVVCWCFCAVYRVNWCSCSVVDPLQVVGHTGVDAIVSWSGATLSPAHNPQEEHRLLVLCYQWSAAVAFTWVLLALNVTGTEHVLSQCDTTVLYTLLCPDAWHLQSPQDVRCWSIFTSSAPTAHCVLTNSP